MADGPEIVTIQTVFGPMATRVGDYVTRIFTVYGAHQRSDLAMLCAFVDPGDLVFDIGAHIGAFTVPLAQRVGPRGRVVAVETDAASHALLVRNVAGNGLKDQVRTVLSAVGTSGANLTYVHLPHHTSASYFVPQLGASEVPCIRLDALAAEEDSPMAVLKIDVEGMEVSVLQSGMEVIARDRPVIWMEVAPRQLARLGATVADLEALLGTQGYLFFCNTHPRDTAQAVFAVQPLRRLAGKGALYDVLAIPAGHARLERVRQYAES